MEKYVIINELSTEIIRYSDSDNCSEGEKALLTDSILKGIYYDSLKEEVQSASKWRLYPIYRFVIKFKFRLSEDKNWEDDMVSFYKMYKTPIDETELDRVVSDTILNLENKHKYKIHPFSDYSYHLDRYETWCLGWFNHYTFDVGQSDEEVLKSFEEYVERYEWMQDDGITFGDKPKDYICLMGAEDRWRWGHKDYSDPNKFIQGEPCRCESCRKAGVIRIDH